MRFVNLTSSSIYFTVDTLGTNDTLATPQFDSPTLTYGQATSSYTLVGPTWYRVEVKESANNTVLSTRTVYIKKQRSATLYWNGAMVGLVYMD
jgi:hypothetical protein